MKPLSEHALEELRCMRDMPTARGVINPGVSHKLIDEGFAEVVMLPSPFPTHKGKLIEHLKITEKGMAKIQRLV